MLYYSAQHLKADGAIMITGSHNPSEYNGFKTVCGSGTLHGEAIQEVLQLIERADFEHGQRDASAPPTPSRLTWTKSPRSSTSTAASKWSPTRATAPPGPVIHRIFEKLNVDVTELFFDMDGHFPNHHPDPTVPANLAHLIEKVRETGAELGIAFDGDSDRIGAVDENGNVIYGDMLLLIYAREILQRKPGATFIGEVKCSQVMYDEIDKLGGNAHHVQDRPLAHQGQDEGRARRAGGRNVRPHVLRRPLPRLRRRALRRLPPDRDRREVRPAALGAARGRAQDGLDSRDSRRLPGRDSSSTWCARVAEHFKKTHKTIDIDGVRVIFPRRLGTAARLQHAAGSGDALRSRQRTSAEAIPIRSGTGAGSSAHGRTPVS